MRTTVVLVPTRNQNWNVGSVARLVTLRGIAVVETKRTMQMLVVRERGLRTNSKTNVDAIHVLPTLNLLNHYLNLNELLRNCHGHNLSKGNIIKIFYHGLNEITQEFLNAAAGGIFLYKTPNQAYQFLKDKVLLKLDWAKNKKTKSSLKKTVAFAVEGSSNSDTDKIMARMDAMTMKIDAQYKEFQSRSKPNPDHNDDDIPISHLKNKLETTTKNHQASIQNLEAKFDRFADKQSGRPSGSIPSNTQPNPKGSSSKPYQPPQAQNEHVNAVFTRSGKSYDPPVNPNDQQNDSETPIIFDSDDEPTPQPKPKTPKTSQRNTNTQTIRTKNSISSTPQKIKNGSSIWKIPRHDPCCSNQRASCRCFSQNAQLWQISQRTRE
ncbi:hypothetical protein Tco_0077594 [Tanacetum coccineum]